MLEPKFGDPWINMIDYSWMCETTSVSVRKITKPINNNILKPNYDKWCKTGTEKKKKVTELAQTKIKVDLILL